MIVKDYLDTLPKKVQKQAELRGGEYYTLFFLLRDITYDLTYQKVPLIGTSYMGNIPMLMNQEISELASKYRVPMSLVEHAVKSALSQFALMKDIVEKTDFEKWYDSERRISMNRSERRKNKGKRDYVFMRRTLQLEPGSTNEVFANAIKEDLRQRGYSEEEIEENILNGHIGGYLDGKFVELRNFSSYNKDKEKNESIGKA